jgi:hypothetical protein
LWWKLIYILITATTLIPRALSWAHLQNPYVANLDTEVASAQTRSSGHFLLNGQEQT